MAERGGQPGNDNNKKNKPWAAALARIDQQSDGAKLRRIAEKVYEMAEAGDIQAIKEIADRCDGKAMQSIDATVRGNLAMVLAAIGRDTRPGTSDDTPVA